MFCLLILVVGLRLLCVYEKCAKMYKKICIVLVITVCLMNHVSAVPQYESVSI